jgi:hypothetical protein
VDVGVGVGVGVARVGVGVEVGAGVCVCTCACCAANMVVVCSLSPLCTKAVSWCSIHLRRLEFALWWRCPHPDPILHAHGALTNMSLSLSPHPPSTQHPYLVGTA